VKCSDIPDKPILRFLAKNIGKWSNHWRLSDNAMPSVADVMPKEANEKLILAKMRQLLKRGLVWGCGCGCRGDWEISDYGLDWLKENSSFSRGKGEG